MAAMLFADLKILGNSVELAQEYAKKLVWLRDFETLNNQHYVSTQQHLLMKSMLGHVDYIVTDGCLLHGLYYNMANPDNTSDKIKTEQRILEFYKSYKNVNIFLTRGSFKYEQAGRIQNEKEAIQSDNVIKELLDKHNIDYECFVPGLDSIKDVIDYIVQKRLELCGK